MTLDYFQCAEHLKNRYSTSATMRLTFVVLNQMWQHLMYRLLLNQINILNRKNCNNHHFSSCTIIRQKLQYVQLFANIWHSFSLLRLINLLGAFSYSSPKLLKSVHGLVLRLDQILYIVELCSFLLIFIKNHQMCFTDNVDAEHFLSLPFSFSFKAPPDVILSLDV